MKKIIMALIGSVLLVAGQSAFAAVPPEATAALTTASTDVGTIGWAVFGVLVAAAAFKYMRRAL
jgi:hypothetical protein